MRRLLRFLRAAAIVVLVFAAVVFLLNTNLLAPMPTARPLLIAHRGLSQNFSREGLTGATCTAKQIFPPEHRYLENTIDGFRAAFAAGADIAEFDVHPTSDGHFVVFHDWTVDCRTEGKGVTREQSLATLKALDIGYGYTADGGRTFPFRGKGVGQMPTLDEVLTTFPERRFLINVKNDDPDEGARLAAAVGRLPEDRQALIMVYGGGKAVDAYKAALPTAKVLGTDNARKCLLRYAALGWTTIVPDACHNTLFMLPANIAPYAWGYPNRLAGRLKAHDTTMVILGDYDGTGFSTGVDDWETLSHLPARFDGAIWTNRIDLIGPLVRQR